MTKTSTQSYTPRSFQEEGTLDYWEGLAQLRKFEHPSFGRLTLYLRKAAKAFNMAADRLDYAERLQGNTLEEYIQEEEKT